MNCVKLLGQGFMAREFYRRVVVSHVRIDALDRFAKLRTPKTIAVLKTLPPYGRREVTLPTDLQNKAPSSKNTIQISINK